MHAPSPQSPTTRGVDRPGAEDPFYKPQEAADYTRLSVDLLAQLRFRGGGPEYLKPTPRTVLYRRSDLDEWLAASRRTSTSSAT